MSPDPPPAHSLPPNAPNAWPVDASGRAFGPARVGDQGYAWRDGAAAAPLPSAPPVHRPGAPRPPGGPAEEAAAAAALLDDRRRQDDAARLRQRALLLELGEEDRLIPWHPRDLDARAHHDARALLTLARAPDLPTSWAARCWSTAATTIADLHADARLRDDAAAADLAVAAAAARAAGDPALQARLAPWRSEAHGEGTVGAGVAGEVAPRADEERQGHASDDALRWPVLADLDAALEAELALERRRTELLATRASSASTARGARPPAPRDVFPAPPANTLTGVAHWTGSRVRLALHDALETLLPNWVVHVGPSPLGRYGALALTAARLATRGTVVLLCPGRRAAREAMRALDDGRAGGVGAVCVVTPTDPASRWPRCVAVVAASPSVQGAALDPHWLHGAAAALRPGPCQPLLVCGVDGCAPRERVVREVELATALVAPTPPRTPLAALLDQALPRPRDLDLAAALREGAWARLGEDGPWLREVLERARAAGPVDLERSAAWRSTDDLCVRAALAWAWEDGPGG